MPTAFISVSDKEGILTLARALDEMRWWIFATDGTEYYLRREGNIRSIHVKTITGFPTLCGGRVKSLHPKIFAGVLAKEKDKVQLDKHNIQPIDLVVANFYPFLKMVQSGATDEECVEKIDIGGPALVLAAAKNHERVTVLVDSADYQQVIDEIGKHGNTLPETREQIALKAEEHVIRYQLTVHHWRKLKHVKALASDDPYKDFYAGGKLARKV